MDDDLPDLDSYLKSAGTIEVVVEIGTGSRTFDTLSEVALASSSTINKRLKEGVELNLIDITHRPTEHGTQKRYELTEAGEHLYGWAQELTLDETVRKRQRLEREFEQERQRWIDKVGDSQPVLLALVEALTPDDAEETVDKDLLEKIPQDIRPQHLTGEKLEDSLIENAETDENNVIEVTDEDNDGETDYIE
jgi:DNA-binding HxlR family transcriptional regulator